MLTEEYLKLSDASFFSSSARESEENTNTKVIKRRFRITYLIKIIKTMGILGLHNLLNYFQFILFSR
jgi:hypothetical protein